MPMKTCKLGDTGPEVTDICLGTMTWGSQMTDESVAHGILDAYVSAGGNFIDTAEMYPVPPRNHYMGTTEVYIGRWLAKHPEVREKVIIASKVPGPGVWSDDAARSHRVAVPGVERDPETPLNLDRASILMCCAGILKRLQTSYLDILYLHWPARPAPLFGDTVYTAEMKDRHPFLPAYPYVPPALEESIQAMAELMKEGKIRHWAISNETTFGVCTIADVCQRLGVPKPVCIQNDFSLVNRRFQYELAEACAPWHHNVSGCPYGVLAGGTLSGKYPVQDEAQASTTTEPEGRHTWNPSFQARYHCQRTRVAAAKYAALARSKGITPVELALAWARQCFFNQSIIIGANSMAQFQECMRSVDVVLDEETLRAIDAIHAEDKTPTSEL